jgi:hypothetical protein
VTIVFFIGAMVGANLNPRPPEIIRTISLPAVTQTVTGPTLTQTLTKTLTTTVNVTMTSLPSTRAKYEFSGVGEASTETFSIPTDKWQILIEVTGAPTAESTMRFGLYVYRQGETKKYFYSKELHRFGQDSTTINGAGKYYLVIDSTNCFWKITVTATP